MTWATRQLGVVADLCLGKMLDQKKNKGLPRHYLGNANVRWGNFDLDNLKDMRFEERELDRYGLRHGDIVMCEGGEPGRCALWTDQVPGIMIQKALHRIRVKSGVDSRFLYYSLSLSGKTGLLDAYFTGATIKHLPGEQLAKIEVEIPPLETQRRIASILGAYDDLIEVNRRRVAVLEEMARGLFEEWFVRFRFPGHESTPILDTPDGPLPEGWKNAVVSDVFSLGRGRSYKSSELAESGGMPFVNLKCILRDGGFKASGLKRYTGEYKQGHVVVRGDIVMAVTDMTQDRRIVGRVGRIPLLSEPAAVISMDLVKVQPTPEVEPSYLYCWLRYSDFGSTAAQYANGANVLHLSPKAIADLPFKLPSKPLIRMYSSIVEPLIQLAEVLETGSQNLATARDLLLPRLMSGQLSVADAERELDKVS